MKPDEGRILACLYAYEDKLSGQCEYAFYDAAARLERVVAALGYVAKECEADIIGNCAGVKAGEGRVLQCLEKSETKVSQTFREQPRWTRMSILNGARLGKFSPDRSIRDYCERIWKVKPVKVELE